MSLTFHRKVIIKENLLCVWEGNFDYLVWTFSNGSPHAQRQDQRGNEGFKSWRSTNRAHFLVQLQTRRLQCILFKTFPQCNWRVVSSDGGVMGRRGPTRKLERTFLQVQVVKGQGVILFLLNLTVYNFAHWGYLWANDGWWYCFLLLPKSCSVPELYKSVPESSCLLNYNWKHASAQYQKYRTI